MISLIQESRHLLDVIVLRDNPGLPQQYSYLQSFYLLHNCTAGTLLLDLPSTEGS